MYELGVNGSNPSSIPSGVPSGVSTTISSTTSGPAPTGTLAVKQSIGPYSYIGCYTEATGQRALTGAKPYVDYNVMTLELCESYCYSQSYTLWGVEYGGECELLLARSSTYSLY